MSPPQPRVPPGVPAGGQYTHKSTAEADLHLEDPFAPPRKKLLQARREMLAEAGYVEPARVSAGIDPNTTAYRRQWWEQTFMLGEYGDARGDYPQMPDDYTPAMTAGRSLEGNRRTHRMCYRGVGVALRMPSATSIKRYATNEGSATFDVPVSSSYPGGSVTGWVRVTRGADGTWATRGLGFSPEDSTYVAEAVQAVLEARRPSRALEDVGDLLDRRRARAAALGTRVEVANSQWIKRLGYDTSTSTMVMVTARSLYGFAVPPEVYQAMSESRSPGQVYNRVVKGRAARVEVRECPRCHRYTTAGAGHRCPPREGPRNPLRVAVNLLHRQAGAGGAIRGA